MSNRRIHCRIVISMEDSSKDVLGVNVIQALSSSAANASTLSHPVDVNQSSAISSNSTSFSEGDVIENVPPPPPPLGIESQFDVLQISSIENQTDVERHNRNENEMVHYHLPNSSRKSIFQKLHNLGLSSSINQANGNDINFKQSNKVNDNSFAFTSSHFATLRKNSNEKRGDFNRVISIEEGLEGSNKPKRQDRASRSSMTRKSLTDYNDSDMKLCEYSNVDSGQKARSGSMSSLSSRGSTLSWFRKRNRNQEKGT